MRSIVRLIIDPKVLSERDTTQLTLGENYNYTYIFVQTEVKITELNMKEKN